MTSTVCTFMSVVLLFECTVQYVWKTFCLCKQMKKASQHVGVYLYVHVQ